MAEIKRITTPLTKEQVAQLKAGESVLITGVIYTGRDAAHKNLLNALSQGQELPIDLKNQIIYYVGLHLPNPDR